GISLPETPREWLTRTDARALSRALVVAEIRGSRERLVSLPLSARIACAHCVGRRGRSGGGVSRARSGSCASACSACRALQASRGLFSQRVTPVRRPARGAHRFARRRHAARTL